MRPTLALAGLAGLLFLTPATRANDPYCWVYFGSAATDTQRGLYVAKLDQSTGELSRADRVGDKSNSQFFAIAPDKKHLYSLAEIPGLGRVPAEAIETYEIDSATGGLKNVAEQDAGGTEACHLSLDPAGKCVLTANYEGAYVEVFPIGPDATVGKRTCIIHQSGSGPDHPRQDAAHPHSINIDPLGKFAVVADLGQDRLFVYRLDTTTATLTPNDPPFAQIEPGSGPRHLTFHHDGKHAFLINELKGTVTALKWNGDKGLLTPYQTISILPKGFNADNRAAEITIGKSGKVVYGSNRGADSLVVLSFNERSGKLAVVQRMTDGVKEPRDYAIDPSGKWLVCGNLAANTATVYSIDPETGKLALVGSVAVPEAICVRFLQI